MALATASIAPLAGAATLQAITDFETLNAGAAPYYIDTGAGRNVLAINAAIHEYRDVFARASTVFSGENGVYDITITALGEIDGEGEYRFLVNGELVGSATNTRVDIDWGEQYHRFDNVTLVTGDTLSVESNAVTNGLIPENDETAFARGRWRALDIDLDTEASANHGATDKVALSLNPDSSWTIVAVGDTVELAMTVANAEGSAVATAPLVTLAVPTGLRFTSSDECVGDSSDGQLQCALAELAAGESVSLSAEFVAIEAGEPEITVQLTSDQPEEVTYDNGFTATWTVRDAQPDPAETTGSPMPTEASAGNEVAATGNTTGANSNNGAESPVNESSANESSTNANEVDVTPQQQQASNNNETTSGAIGIYLLGLLLVARGWCSAMRRRVVADDTRNL